MRRGDNKRILTEYDVKLVKNSIETSAAEWARILGVSDKRIYQIRPKAQTHNRRNGRGGTDTVCRVCGTQLRYCNFVTDGNGRVFEVCDAGHRLRLEVQEDAPLD